MFCVVISCSNNKLRLRENRNSHRPLHREINFLFIHLISSCFSRIWIGMLTKHGAGSHLPTQSQWRDLLLAWFTLETLCPGWNYTVSHMMTESRVFDDLNHLSAVREELASMSVIKHNKMLRNGGKRNH